MKSELNGSSKALLEGLMFRIPKVRTIYQLIELPTISSVKHPEVDNILNHFKDPVVILSIGVLFNCYFIERESKNSYHYIEVSSQARYGKVKRTELYDIIHDNFKFEDCVPEPFSRKLVCILDYSNGLDNLEGVIVSKDRKRGNKIYPGNLSFGKNKNVKPLKIDSHKWLMNILNNIDISGEEN